MSSSDMKDMMTQLLQNGQLWVLNLQTNVLSALLVSVLNKKDPRRGRAANGLLAD